MTWLVLDPAVSHENPKALGLSISNCICLKPALAGDPLGTADPKFSEFARRLLRPQARQS